MTLPPTGGPTALPDEWRFYLASWVIQDGNYDDFVVGETRAFAVHLFNPILKASPTRLTRVAPLKDWQYEVGGEVVHVSRGLVLVDFGLMAYHEQGRIQAGNGEWLEGSLGLEVDCFRYYEVHAQVPGVPPAVYTWTIAGISIETAPLVHDPARNMWIREESQRAWSSISRTDAWHDDGGHAEYLLHCRLQDIPPTFRP